VILHNTDQDQTRIFQDRLRNGIVLLPGQKREIDMLVEEIARLRYLGRSDRVSTSLATRWASRYRRIR
jgi:hypothetical protein